MMMANREYNYDYNYDSAAAAAEGEWYMQCTHTPEHHAASAVLLSVQAAPLLLHSG